MIKPLRIRGSFTDSTDARKLGLLVLALAGGALLQARRSRKREPPRRRQTSKIRTISGEARGLHGAAAMLALSVLADSTVEHYRGSFENLGMYAPLITSATVVWSGAQGAFAAQTDSRHVRIGNYSIAVIIGAVGTGFHLYNIVKRPGGFGWLNLFYAAPPGAPAALALAGLLGIAAEQLGNSRPNETPTLLSLPAGRTLAALASVGIAGTVSEAGLLHFRGAFHNPFMFVPVIIPPVAAVLLARAAVEGGPAPRTAARAWLGVTALLGIVGVGFHAYGVSRAMGGWRNWSQNLIDGPPLPAPPAFAALALAGLSALSLMKEQQRG